MSQHLAACVLLVQSMNQHGIARMCRLLAVVQPALSSLGAAGAAFRPESARAFEKARAYYGLLMLPADGLIKAAAEKPKRFTSAEYMALLQVCTHPPYLDPKQLTSMILKEQTACTNAAIKIIREDPKVMASLYPRNEISIWLAQVDYAGRDVTGDHLSQLSKIVGAKDPKGRSLFASATSMPFVSSASLKPSAVSTR